MSALVGDAQRGVGSALLGLTAVRAGVPVRGMHMSRVAEASAKGKAGVVVGGTDVTAAAAAAPARNAWARVNVKVQVGDSKWTVLPKATLGANEAGVMEAAAGKFTAALSGVVLSKCTLRVLPSVAGDRPSEAEVSSSVQLKRGKTLREFFSVPPSGGYIWARVELPGDYGQRRDCVGARCEEACLHAAPLPIRLCSYWRQGAWRRSGCWSSVGRCVAWKFHTP